MICTCAASVCDCVWGCVWLSLKLCVIVTAAMCDCEWGCVWLWPRLCVVVSKAVCDCHWSCVWLWPQLCVIVSEAVCDCHRGCVLWMSRMCLPTWRYSRRYLHVLYTTSTTQVSTTSTSSLQVLTFTFPPDGVYSSHGLVLYAGRGLCDKLDDICRPDVTPGLRSFDYFML